MATRIPLLPAALTALALLAGCTTVPDAPENANPFDPEGTAPGTGYDLTAVVDGDEVTLSWPSREVNTWFVRHSTTTDEYVDMDEISVEFLVNIDAGVATLVHGSPDLEAVNYYAVRGQGMVPGVSIAVDVPLFVQPGGGVSNVGTRDVTVDVRTGVGDRVELASSEDFSDAVPFDVVPDSLFSLDWQLPTAPSAGTTLTVYARSLTGSTVGPPNSADFTANFSPQIAPVSGQRLVGNVQTVVDTVVVLQPTGEGITGLRLTLADSGDTTVVDDPTAPFSLEVPSDTEETLVWSAIFRGDFGYDVTRSVELRPATEIGEVSLEILDGSTTTALRDVQLLVGPGGAGEMVVSEDPGFADTTWMAATDTLDFVLSEGFGIKTIYAVFRSPFTDETPVASTSITYVVPPARGPTTEGGSR